MMELKSGLIEDEELIHCNNGPAMIYADGTQMWYQHDVCHREDGPAIMFADGTENMGLSRRTTS